MMSIASRTVNRLRRMRHVLLPDSRTVKGGLIDSLRPASADRRARSIEQLESRLLLDGMPLTAPSADLPYDEPYVAGRLMAGVPTVAWDGGGDGASWHDPLNWSDDVLPGLEDRVLISVAADPTITLTASAGAVSIAGLQCDEAFVLSGGSLTITGAGTSRIDADFSTTAGTLKATGEGTILRATGTGTGANTTFRADNGGVLDLIGLTSLRRVNILADTAGQILFPTMTTYTGSNSGHTTIEAEGPGSRIDLSGLETLAGGGYKYANYSRYYYRTNINALDGGEVALAGAVTHNPSGGHGNRITVDGADSELDVAGVTRLTHSSLTVSTPLDLTFSLTTEVIATSITAGAGVTLSFPAATDLTSVNLTANDGGQILFPIATNYTGSNSADTTVEANGIGSRINLSALETFAGGGHRYSNYTHYHYRTYVNVLDGGEVNLAGALTTNPSGGYGNRITVDGLDSNMDVSGVTSLQATYATVSDASVIFDAATTLTSVNLSVDTGGQILFPVATTYTGSNSANTTIQADGIGSWIDLSALETFAGGGYRYSNYTHYNYRTDIKATQGGQVDLAGAVTHNPSGGYGNRIIVDSVDSMLGTAGITSLTNTTLSGLGVVRVGEELQVQGGSTVRPGGGIGTLAVLGDAAFQYGSTMAIELSGSGTPVAGVNNDLIAFEDLTLTDNPALHLKWLIDEAGDGLFGGIYTIATYAGNLVGTFAAPKLTVAHTGGNASAYIDTSYGIGGIDYGSGTDDAITIKLMSPLVGDANLDGDVDIWQPNGKGDAQILSSNLGRTSGANWTHGDFNGDGDVDVWAFNGSGDAQLLSENLGKRIDMVHRQAAMEAQGTAEVPIDWPMEQQSVRSKSTNSKDVEATVDLLLATQWA